MRWHRCIDMLAPSVFSPKVTPDPASAERLNAKLEQAMAKLKQGNQRSQLTRRATPF
ncbi:MAG: hypothetical protein AB7F79_06895 [Steroidobacteraceae bacterium]